jgi:hypothetical protein
MALPLPTHTHTHTHTTRDRLAALRQEAERRAAAARAGYGSYSEISEGEFLEAVTKTENVVVHFYHRDFERCKIVDKHMEGLAKKYLDTRFLKLSAPVRGCGGVGGMARWGVVAAQQRRATSRGAARRAAVHMFTAAVAPACTFAPPGRALLHGQAGCACAAGSRAVQGRRERGQAGRL